MRLKKREKKDYFNVEYILVNQFEMIILSGHIGGSC